MKKIKSALYIIALLIMGIVVIGTTLTNGSNSKRKFLIILQAGKESHEGMARAVHALLYTKELKQHGYDVILLFDGAGTEWIQDWSDSKSTDKLAAMYHELQKLGVTEIICGFCAGAFKVKKDLEKRKIKTTAEFEGHPSIVKWVDRGFQIIAL